jgi:ATP-binding protein involved in chromosome partitioning
MALSKQFIRDTLKQVDLPSGGDLVSSGALTWVAACDAIANLRVHLPGSPDARAMKNLAALIDTTLRAEAASANIPLDRLGVQFVNHAGDVIASFGDAPTQATTPPADPRSEDHGSGIPGVKHIIAVGAGKGGVGKSTVAVNLAVALARQGQSVGLLDGDIYGPSLPTLLGLDALEQTVLDGQLQPFLVHGVKAVTLGKMVDPDKPLIWRGPMAHGAFKQLYERTDWGELDTLVIDLPPGTGDVPLTMAQSLRLTGAVVVCTPQRVAQDDAVRAVGMFRQLGVEILGVVENMSYFVGDDGKTYDIFGRGGAEQMAQRLGLPFLGAIPINTALRANGDAGDPTRNFVPATAGGDALPGALEGLARNTQSQITLASIQQARSAPTLSIS